MNETTKDTTLNADIKSVYTKPFWVTKENMNDTVIKDQMTATAQSDGGNIAKACKDTGIQ